MSSDEQRKRLLAEMAEERFGPVPVAELQRPLPEQIGTGGPDTPANVAARRRALMDPDQARDPNGKYTKPADSEEENE